MIETILGIFGTIHSTINKKKGIEKMDKVIFSNKYIALYFTTLTMGLGFTITPQNKSFHLLLGVFDLEICRLED